MRKKFQELFLDSTVRQLQITNCLHIFSENRGEVLEDCNHKLEKFHNDNPDFISACCIHMLKYHTVFHKIVIAD